MYLIGPKPSGYWITPEMTRAHGILIPGRCYQVTQAFSDYDRDVHKFGETWKFLGNNFLAYDDGLSLFVSLDGTQEWHIRMQLRPDEQGPTMEKLEQHVASVPCSF